MDKGIFLPSEYLDTSLMISYLQALLNICPSVKCTAVKTTDDKLKGFKVYFSDPKEAAVLKKGHITVDTQRVRIYPVTSTFLIQGKNKRADDSFRVALRETIEEVLEMYVLSMDDLGKTYDYEKWVVKIDIPEFEVSEGEIYSQLSTRLFERDISVRPWCRICNEPGHFFKECRENKTLNSEAKKTKNLDFYFKATTSNNHEFGRDCQTESISKSSPTSPTTVRDGGYSEINLESTDSYAVKLGEEEILKEMPDLRKNLKNGSKTRTTFGDLSKDIKIEVEEEQEQQNKKKHSEKNRKTLVYHSDTGELLLKSEFQRDDSTSNVFHSENSDDDFSILEPETSPNFSRTDDTEFSEASESPTTSRNDCTTEAPRQRRAKPTARVEVTTVLSDRLQNCINHACDAHKVLDRQKLDAFFTHVKKKSNPIRIALNYTKDADGLKLQLETILDRYYNTPQTGTKEDMQFIKWLNGLVERFDGTIPRKRKPTNKISGGPPNKK